MVINDICLINPPLSVNEFPHLALPLLKGYLVKQGHKNVKAKDFNVEIMDQIISEGLEKVEKYFFERNMKVSYREIKNKYDSARQVLVEEDRGKDDKAFKIINTYLRIAGSNIFDICFCPDSLGKIKAEYSKCDVYKDANKIIMFIRQEILPYFAKNPAKVVGISVPFTSQIFYALIIGREIKRLFPSTKVVMGGPQISLFGKLLAEHKPFREAFDAMIYGQGELALDSYLKQAFEKGNLEAVPNLMYIDSTGNIKVNSEENITDIEEIPLPDFSDLPLNKYIYGKIPYQMSRGCYWGKCVFCSYHDNKSYNYKNTERIISDIQEIKNRYGRRFIQFIDDAIRPDILSDFAESLIRNKINIKYEAYLRLDPRFTMEKCELLHKSGLKSVLFGFESANDRILKLVKKGTSIETMKIVLNNMKFAGIQNILSCMVGFPTETREEAWESMEFLKKYKDFYYHVFIVHFGMISDMCKSMEQYDVAEINFNDLIRYDDTGFVALGYPYKTKSGMTVEEALEVIKEGREYLGIKIFEDNFFS